MFPVFATPPLNPGVPGAPPTKLYDPVHVFVPYATNESPPDPPGPAPPPAGPLV